MTDARSPIQPHQEFSASEAGDELRRRIGNGSGVEELRMGPVLRAVLAASIAVTAASAMPGTATAAGQQERGRNARQPAPIAQPQVPARPAAGPEQALQEWLDHLEVLPNLDPPPPVLPPPSAGRQGQWTGLFRRPAPPAMSRPAGPVDPFAAAPPAAARPGAGGAPPVWSGGGGAVVQAVVRAPDIHEQSPDEWWPEVVQAARYEGVHPDVLWAIARCESGFRNVPTSVRNPDGSPASTAFGPWQFTEGTWKGTSRTRPDLQLSASDRFVPGRQGTGAAALVSEIEKGLTKNIGRAATTIDVYGVWMFGPRYGAQVARLPEQAPLAAAGMPQEWLVSHGMVDWSVGKYRTEMGRRLGDKHAMLMVRSGPQPKPSFAISATMTDMMMEGWSPIRIIPPAPAGAPVTEDRSRRDQRPASLQIEPPSQPAVQPRPSVPARPAALQPVAARPGIVRPRTDDDDDSHNMSSGKPF